MSRFRGASALVRAVVLTAISLLIVGVIYEVSGFSALGVVAGTWQGAVAAPGAAASTLRWATPLLLMGLGVLVAVRAGFFNVGAQGQFYVGATAALTVALALPDGQPMLVVPLGFAAAMAAGALYSLVPGFLRVRFGTDEVITTLMTNFIAGFWLLYITAGPLQDPNGSGEATVSRVINKLYRISDSSGVSLLTIAICAVAAVVTWVLIRRTSFGVVSGLAGRNPVMARWQGIDVGRVGLLSFAISGALAGVAGAVELFGPAGRLASGFGPNLGFTAILVAIVGGLDVRGIVAAALFFGGLDAALIYLPVVQPVPSSALDLLRGTVAMLITITAVPPLLRWRRRTHDTTPDTRTSKVAA